MDQLDSDEDLNFFSSLLDEGEGKSTHCLEHEISELPCKAGLGGGCMEMETNDGLLNHQSTALKHNNSVSLTEDDGDIFQRKHSKCKVFDGRIKYDASLYKKYSDLETSQLRNKLRDLKYEISAISDILKERSASDLFPKPGTISKSLEETVKKIDIPKEANASAILLETLPVKTEIVPIKVTSGSDPHKGLPNRAALLELTGLRDSSDDDDEDMYPNKPVYSSYGLEIKKRITHDLEFKRENNPVEKKSPDPPKVFKSSKAEFYVDRFSGMKVSKPDLNPSQLASMMDGKKMIRMHEIKSYVKNNEIPGDWVTIGALVNKTDSKISKSGNAYSIWTLSDLRNCEKCVKLYLFNSAHKVLWKTIVGTVVGILNANILGNREMTPGIDISLSIETEQKLLSIGKSVDLGVCASQTKNGGKCTNVVNKSVCEYCSFHVQKEYKKSSLKRSDLMSTYSGMVPKKFEQRQVLGVMQQAVKQRKKAQPKLTLESLKLKSQANEILSGKRNTEGTTLEDLVKVPSFGSRNLVKHLNSLTEEKKETNTPTPIKTASDLLISHTKKIKLEQSVPKKLIIPKQDPNSVRSRDKVKDLDSWRKKMMDKLGSPTEEDPRCSKIELSDEEFQKILNAKSQFAELLSEEEALKELEYFDILEKKEMCENKMESITEVPVVATICSKCKYLAFTAAPQCLENNHPTSKVKTFKRFFACVECSNNIISLYRYPIQPCTKCGGSKWKRSAMAKERKVPKLANELLSIRGNEMKFLNSLAGDKFIHL